MVRLFTLTGLALFAHASAYACKAPAWNGQFPVPIPTHSIGAEWTYIPAADWPSTTLSMVGMDKKHVRFLINDRHSYQESRASYSDVNPLRSGSKITLPFPLTAGQTWKDTFTEPGEYIGNAHFRYRYQESSFSEIQAIEDITVAAGTFKTIRIGRVSSWVKSQPQALDGQQRSQLDITQPVQVEGYVLTQMWYAPSIGRVVLKASLNIGDSFYAHAAKGLLTNKKTSVVELISYRTAQVTCSGKKPLWARQAEQYVPLGYAAIPSDTWEWDLRMKPHMASKE